jgi:alpha-D-ribose 1-methylphosphonate 5-triphosphate synthase subunit PhnL
VTTDKLYITITMVFDLDMITGGYTRMREPVEAAILGAVKPLFSATKILCSRLWEVTPTQVSGGDISKMGFATIPVVSRRVGVHGPLM